MTVTKHETGDHVISGLPAGFNWTAILQAFIAALLAAFQAGKTPPATPPATP